MNKAEENALREQLAQLTEANNKLAAENLTLSQGEVAPVLAQLNEAKEKIVSLEGEITEATAKIAEQEEALKSQEEATAKIAELEAELEAQKGANVELIGNLEAAKSAVSSTKPTILVGTKTYTGRGKWLDRHSKTYVTLEQCATDEKLLKRSLESGIVKLYTPEEGGAE